MAKRTLRAETFDIDLLEARYPDCIYIEKKVDYSKLYAKAKAHQVTGEPIPGVIIMNADGTTIPSVTQQVVAENQAAASSPSPADYIAA